MPARGHAVALAVVTATGCAATGCAAGHNGDASSPRPTAVPTVVVTHPGPVRTLVRSGQVAAAGTTLTLHAQAGVVVRLTAARPRLSRDRLSSSYGYAPQHGYYATFSLTIVNVGRRRIQIGPHDFRDRVPGQGSVTSYDGNAPFSGAPRQLDTTRLEPGQRVRAPLTFDVSSRRGVLSYAPDGSPALSWRY